MRANVIVQITMSRVNLTLIQHILGVLQNRCQPLCSLTNEVPCRSVGISSCG